MAEKGFGVKEINLIGASGTPTIESPNNLNLNAVNVAISTNVSIGGTLSVTGNVSVGGTLTYEDVTNIDSVGIVTARQGLRVPDGDVNNNYISAGDSQDIKIYHDGSNSYVKDQGTGQLVIDGNAVILQYSAATKLATTSTGVSITGTLAATAVTGDGSALTGIAVTEAPVVDYTITADSGSNYYFHGGGVDETDGNPDLYLIRGQKYRFNNTTGTGHPFRFTSTGNANAGYSNGVTGTESGVQFWTIPYDAPAKLFYVCTIHGGMVGNIYIRGANGQNDNVGLTTFSGQITANDTINLASTKKLSMAADVFKIYHATNAAIINESGNFIINNNTSNTDIIVSTGSGPTEAFRIDSSGRVKIGNDFSATAEADDLIVGNLSGGHGITVFSQNNEGGFLCFGDTNTSGVDSRRGVIRYQQSDDSMRFAVNGNNEVMRIASDYKVMVGMTTTSTSTTNNNFELAGTKMLKVGHMYMGYVIGTGNNSDGVLILHKMGQNVGLQFSGMLTIHSYTGSAYLSGCIVVRYNTDAVTRELTLQKAASGANFQLVSGTISGESGTYFGIKKNGGGTGSFYVNALIAGNIESYGGIREVSNSNWTTSTTHFTVT